MVTTLALAALRASMVLAGYTYLGYPLALLAWSAVRPRRPRPGPRTEPFPQLSVTVPVHNGAAVIGAALEAILAADYPPDRRQVLVVSDASTDGTDDVVRGFADRGVELLRLPHRCGKTAAENAARTHLRGEIIVNSDAGVRIAPRALRRLVAALAAPDVGVASGRDVSVTDPGRATTRGERSYVGYEMWVRALETRVAGIVGASGCLYAIRAALHDRVVPDTLSRDFSSALEAWRRGYRAVSVPEAVCYVPRTGSLQEEYRRKVRTIQRGIATLARERWALDPRRSPTLAWMVFSHKVCRWLLPLAGVAACVALGVLGWGAAWARVALAAAVGAIALAVTGWSWPATRPMPWLVAWPAYFVWGNVAVLNAALRLSRGRGTAVWEPTRRATA
jgi:cellulose synthase/poly-beta-1,6-N-acetylglucosamine synthase-like glycosyltransferase